MPVCCTMETHNGRKCCPTQMIGICKTFRGRKLRPIGEGFGPNALRNYVPAPNYETSKYSSKKNEAHYHGGNQENKGGSECPMQVPVVRSAANGRDVV